MTPDKRKTKDQLIQEISALREKAEIYDSYQLRREEFVKAIRRMLDLSPVPIMVSDKYQKITYLNARFEQIFGYDRQEISTLKDWWCASDPDKASKQETNEHWQQTLAESMLACAEIRPIERGIICKDGARRYIEFKFVPLLDQYMIYGNDLTDARRTEEELFHANEKLKQWICELEVQNSRMNTLRRMGEAFHACHNVQDAVPVIRQYGPQLFPKTNGSLYIFDEEQEKMTSVVKWGNYSNEEVVLNPDDCEAMRRGKPFEEKSSTSETPDILSRRCLCGEQNWFGTTKHMCIPMRAAGESQGLMHIGFHDEDDDYERSVKELALVVTEHMALAMANLNLQETLRSQAIRDPLTSLFNRRYMEECLDREFHRADRRRHPISIVIIDIDHFKLFNDNYGHDAGDVLLTRLSSIMQKSVRKEDIVCRFGGEEFVLIMPDMPIDVAINRAMALREGVRNTEFDYDGHNLGKVTISLGVASFPAHGRTAQMVIKSADEALYRAKKSGRDRVEVGTVKI